VIFHHRVFGIVPDRSRDRGDGSSTEDDDLVLIEDDLVLIEKEELISETESEWSAVVGREHDPSFALDEQSRLAKYVVPARIVRCEPGHELYLRRAMVADVPKQRKAQARGGFGELFGAESEGSSAPPAPTDRSRNEGARRRMSGGGALACAPLGGPLRTGGERVLTDSSTSSSKAFARARDDV
jgi:hypothetical protein